MGACVAIDVLPSDLTVLTDLLRELPDGLGQRSSLAPGVQIPCAIVAAYIPSRTGCAPGRPQ
eukprot:6525479-Pyramimonas_sp.AAC.1